jgi:hypothetical protein
LEARALREVNCMDDSHEKLANLVSALYSKLDEAYDLAEQLQEVAQTNWELRQARRIAKRINRLQENAVELRDNLEDQDK